MVRGMLWGSRDVGVVNSLIVLGARCARVYLLCEIHYHRTSSRTYGLLNNTHYNMFTS